MLGSPFTCKFRANGQSHQWSSKIAGGKTVGLGYQTDHRGTGGWASGEGGEGMVHSGGGLTALESRLPKEPYRIHSNRCLITSPAVVADFNQLFVPLGRYRLGHGAVHIITDDGLSFHLKYQIWYGPNVQSGHDELEKWCWSTW